MRPSNLSVLNYSVVGLGDGRMDIYIEVHAILSRLIVHLSARDELKMYLTIRRYSKELLAENKLVVIAQFDEISEMKIWNELETENCYAVA